MRVLSLNVALGMAAMGLPEARQDQTENASEDTKENTEEAKNLDEAQVQEAMAAGVGSDWRELDETLRSRVTRVVQKRFTPYWFRLWQSLMTNGPRRRMWKAQNHRNDAGVGPTATQGYAKNVTLNRGECRARHRLDNMKNEKRNGR